MYEPRTRAGQAAWLLLAGILAAWLGGCSTVAKSDIGHVGSTSAFAGPSCPAPEKIRRVSLDHRGTFKPGKARMISFNRSINTAKMVTVAAVGDVLLHDRLQKNSAKHHNGFSDLWADIADLLKAADVTYGNLEGPAARNVAPGGRLTKKLPKGLYDGYVYGGYPAFNYHPDIVKALKASGFDIVSTANNHSLDRHALGVDKTIEALREAGLAYTGTRHRKLPNQTWHAVTPVSSKAGKFNIAWLSCTYGTNGIRDRHGQVLHCYKKKAEMLRMIAALRARKDIHAVFVTPHWGLEYRGAPTTKQRKLAYDWLEAGATAVLGGHPHVMQPWERYVTRDGRETMIVYSLGNFVSNQLGVPRRSSVIALLGLMPNAKDRGRLSIVTAGFIPIRMRLQVTKAGVRVAAQAIDRVRGAKAKKSAAGNRKHILKFLPAGNLLPPKTPFWAGRDCTQRARRASRK